MRTSQARADELAEGARRMGLSKGDYIHYLCFGVLHEGHRPSRPITPHRGEPAAIAALKDAGAPLNRTARTANIYNELPPRTGPDLDRVTATLDTHAAAIKAGKSVDLALQLSAIGNNVQQLRRVARSSAVKLEGLDGLASRIEKIVASKVADAAPRRKKRRAAP